MDAAGASLRRYSGSATSSLDEDLREIENAGSGRRRRSRGFVDVSGQLRRSRRRSSCATIPMRGLDGCCCICLRSGTRLWIGINRGTGLPFKGNELVSGFSPQFHHVFPRGFLTDRATGKPRTGISAEQIEALANIAIIGAGVNIRISDKEPLAYFAKYEIDEKKRVQQFIEGPVESMTAENYPAWLLARAHLLATVSNAFWQS